MRSLLPEEAWLFVPVPGPAWQAHPWDEIEICRLIHVGEVEQAGNLRLPKSPDWRGTLAEFILAGHAIIRTGGRADPVLRLKPSRIQAADDGVGLPADQMGESMFRIENVISDSVVMSFHGMFPSDDVRAGRHARTEVRILAVDEIGTFRSGTSI
jgi:hypothetical protein